MGPPADRSDEAPAARSDHVRQVFEWLEKNVKVYPAPSRVRLWNFKVDWTALRGSFCVALDGVELEEPLRFGLDLGGQVDFYLPVFTSPLGAPASYDAIELTAETQRAITRALRSVIPRIRGAGLDWVSGQFTTAHDSVSSRVLDPAAWEAAQRLLSDSSYTIEVDVAVRK
jgi:hypothetical protein